MLPKKGFIVPRARQVDMVPQIWNGYSETGSGTLKYYPNKLNNIHYFFENRGSTIVYLQKEMDGCGKLILKKYLKDKNFLSKIVKLHNRLGKEGEQLAWQVLGRLNEIEGAEILAKLKQIQKAWIDFDQVNVLAWFIGGEYLKEYLSEVLTSKYHVLPREMETLFAAKILSLPTQEELVVLKLALKYQDGTPDQKVFHRLEREFGWIPYGYDGPIFWDQQHFKKKFLKLAKLSRIVLERRVSNIETGVRRVKKEQKAIVAKYRVERSLQQQLGQMQTLIVITDERKKFQFQLHYAFHEVLKKLVGFSRLTLDELKYLDVSEMETMSRTEEFSKWKKLAQKRMKELMYLHIADGRVKKWAVGKAVKTIRAKFLEELGIIKEIKGQIGNRTKSPVVTGRVRIIMNSRDIGKMKKGEVLVTWMTSPDFVPAMRKARAVVTDEGGITCHAAIVSRELGIPAIIGTQIATKILKDGDLVEVDANKGIVKKIK
jgi:phosphohistidine swiveling domain-containing protein